MQRRGFIAGAAAIAVPLQCAGAQQPQRVRRVGVMMAFSESDPFAQACMAAFAAALGRAGWVEGKNVLIDYRFAAGDPALFKKHAAELVSLSPDVILASTPPAVIAVRQQTPTVPVVFVFMIDPVGLGLVQSLARPGGRTTGFGSFDPPLMGKWLELLKEIAPGIRRVAVIFNPDTTIASAFNGAIEAAAPSFGITAKPLPVHDAPEIEEAIAAEAREPGGSLITLPDSFNLTHRAVIIAAAARHALPLMGLGEFFPRTGALMSYFFDPVDTFAQAASYIDRILKGASPAELPVQQPTKFSLIINLNTAKALGLTVPQSLLQRADEVIE
jgi:putative ABC transport system substrate-binding protein